MVYSQVSQAQGFYVKISGGFGTGASTDLLTPNVSQDSSMILGQYGSYGEGFVPALGFGYFFNNYVGLEITGTYLIGKKFEHVHTEDDVTETHKKWGDGLLISPSLMVKAPMKSITPYVRFGGVLGLVKVKEEETESGTGAKTGSNKTEHNGSTALGFNGALGIMFKAGKTINIFAEIFGMGMAYGPEKRENTETFAGETPDETITYEEEFPINSALTELRPHFPFSNFGLSVGITLNFGKTKKTK